MEKAADRAIGRGLGLAKEYKQVLVGAGLLGSAFFYKSIVGYVDGAVIAPLQEAFAKGLSPHELALGVAFGVVSGLSSPGLTMLVLGALLSLSSFLFGVSLAAPQVAVAAACNAALTLPDLFLWQRLYSRLGSALLPGGQYVRPFVAGILPWAASAPLLFLLSYWPSRSLFALFLKQ